jgi:hypothetical protein
MDKFSEAWAEFGSRLGDMLFKAEWSTEYINNLPDSSFLYIEDGGEKDDAGKTTPRSLRHLPYKDAEGNVDLPHLRNAISRLGQSATGTGKDGWLNDRLRNSLLSRARSLLKRETGEEKEKKNFWTVKTKQGYRWFTVSSTAYLDRENEIVSKEALQRVVDRAPSGDLGPLRFWHTKGFDFGDCDFRMLDGLCLIESGLWRDDPISQAVRKAVEKSVDDYIISIGFWPSVKDVEQDVTIKGAKVRTIFNDIDIAERSFLPREWSSNTFTLLGTQGGSDDMGMKNARHEVFRGLIGDDDLFEQFMTQVDEINAKAAEDDAIFKGWDDEENPLQAFTQKISKEHEDAAGELKTALQIMEKETMEEDGRRLLPAVLLKAQALLPEELSEELEGILKEIAEDDSSQKEKDAPEEEPEEDPAEKDSPEKGEGSVSDEDLLKLFQKMQDQLDDLGERFSDLVSEEAPKMTKRRPVEKEENVEKDSADETGDTLETPRVVEAIGEKMRHRLNSVQ